MSDWQTRLRLLEGLSIEDKLYVEGKLLGYDDARAAQYFRDSELLEHTLQRLKALLPDTGEV